MTDIDVGSEALHPATLPWELDHGITDAEGNSAIVDQHRVVVAFMSDDGLDEDEADGIIEERGRLMAAAPEMAVALRIARRCIAEIPIADYFDGDKDLAIIDAALAKAGAAEIDG